MARVRRSLARRIRESIPKPRLTPTTERRASLRSRFNRVKPLVGKWRGTSSLSPGGNSGTATPSASGVRVAGKISSDIIGRTITGRYIKDDLLDRWATIQAGQLPPDDPTPPAPTPEQVEEREREELEDIQRWGERRNDQIREDTHSEVQSLNRAADEAEATYGRGRPAALRRAARLREQAEQTMADGERKLERVADTVRERRDDARRRIQREADRAEEAVQERIRQLQKGLNKEVEKEVNANYFFSQDFELEGFELI